MRDHRAGLWNRFQPGEALREAECLGGDGDGVGHLDEFLRHRRARRQIVARQIGLAGLADGMQEAEHGLDGDLAARLLPMLAAFHQQRVLRAGRIAEAAIVAHAQAGLVALVGHDRRRHADFGSKLAALGERAGQHQRRRGLLHRMQVKQQIDLGQQRLDLAGAVQFDRTARAVQRIGAPDAVHVLIDEARGGRVIGIEARIGGDVAEDQGQPAFGRHEFLAQQQVERMGAADLVAVDQRGDRRLRPGLAGVEQMGIGNADIAFAVLGDRDGQQGIGGQRGHDGSGGFLCESGKGQPL